MASEKGSAEADIGPMKGRAMAENAETSGNPRDLVSPPSEAVLFNQAAPTGQRLIIEIDGVLHDYCHDESLDRAERFARILDAEMEWIEGFVSHAPSVGNHYESIL